MKTPKERLSKVATPAAHRRPDARSIAMQVVERVLYDQAYAAAALSAEFSKYPQLSARERAFATELTYTALRSRRALEERLSAQAPRGLPKDRVIRAALLVAAVQALLLDKATLAIAVDAAVTRVKAQRGIKPAGFVNALLRRTAEQPALNRAAALRANLPQWLHERLVAAVGAEEADALIGAHESIGTSPNSIDIRLVKGRAVPEWLIDATPGRWLPETRRVSGIGDPRGYPEFENGDFVIQEEGAQLIAWALDVPEGARVLDVCAGRGQKTSLLAERIGPDGAVWSTDLHENKLSALREEMKRLHLSNVQTQALDWSVGGGHLPTDFEFALVDAPCTGTGTLYKRPEILDRLKPDDPGRMGELAAQILRNVAQYCRSGAQVIYAVCSVLPEEAEAVLSRVQDVFEPRPFKTQALRSAFGNEDCAGRLLPLRHGTDGYFLAQLQKR